MEVDVDDVIQSGTFVVGSAQATGTVVSFPTPFHTDANSAEEIDVNVSFKEGGTLSVVTFDTVTNTGFRVYLKDILTAAVDQTGTITWSARGY